VEGGGKRGKIGGGWGGGGERRRERGFVRNFWGGMMYY